ncbi:hypothetical protein TDB9533_03037 [Thalassocella blandensis]|nr:hypothetical protein TDB9533_03037 [Thalassocella blandensis]
MDPVAHTLIGASLAETGLKRLSPYATAALIIGANLPDIDVVADFWGEDTSLYFRRGWSHGILALVILPLVLAGLLWCWDRWRSRKRAPGASPPFRLGVIVALCYVAVLSHPFLDWLNTYGVRILMPFDGRWFYGDTLFIIDPWVWLLAAAGVVLAHSSHKLSISVWLLLGAIMSYVILSTNLAALPVKVVWCVGVIAIIVLKWRAQIQATQPMATVQPTFIEHVARSGVTLLALYIACVYGLARHAENQLFDPQRPPLEVQANPVPGVPFSHRRVVVFEDEYQVITADGKQYSVPRSEPNDIVLTAMEDKSIRGFTNWMRYPYWRVEEQNNSWLVSFWDLRYQGPDMSGHAIGHVQVRVAKDRVEKERVEKEP